ncbi:MAG: manganese catalase family protein [Clostridia bacterium]|nr:manganese catalase family protein [Clostridia bacterium]
MWSYDKKLQYPVNIKNPNPQLAKLIITQFGGPDGEVGAAMRYLSQRYSMPYNEAIGILTDIGTEELAHMEMVCAIVHQLTRNLTEQQIKDGGFADYFVDHTVGLYPVAASGVPWSASTMQSTGDPIADLSEDLGAEQKARLTYDNILRFCDDRDVADPIRFLREREIVHYQRFGEPKQLT